MRNEGWYEMRAAEGGREPEGGAALPPAPRGGDWAAGGGGGRAGAGPAGEGRRARGGAAGRRPGPADPSAWTRPPPLPGAQTFPWISRPRLSSSSRSPPVPASPGRVSDCLSQELKIFLITGVGGFCGWPCHRRRPRPAPLRTSPWEAGEGAGARRAGRAAPFPAAPTKGHSLRGTRKQELPGSSPRSAAGAPMRALPGVGPFDRCPLSLEELSLPSV